METIGVIFGVVVVAAIFFIIMLKNLIYVCEPNEVLVIAGKSKKRVAGRKNFVGYRLVNGGKTIRIPILEDVYKMDISNIPIDIRITKAFSKGGVPLNVQAVANIKVESGAGIHNAIERFLGKSKKQIAQVAQETLEGNLRGVLASLTPEEVNDDKIAFTKKLLDEADEDFLKLGLTLDNLQIQQVSDNVGYLDSIGRKQTALIQRDARILEAKDKATAAIRDAENNKSTKIVELNNRISILQQDSKQMLNDALTRRKAVVAEANARVVKEIAKTKGAIKINLANIDKVKHKLTAEVIKPAEAKRDRLIEEAKTGSAKIIADSLRNIITAWKAAGRNGKNIFIMEKIDPILDTIVGAIKNIEIEKVTVIDSKLTSGEDANPMVKAISALEQLKETTGVDVASRYLYQYK